MLSQLTQHETQTNKDLQALIDKKHLTINERVIPTSWVRWQGESPLLIWRPRPTEQLLRIVVSTEAGDLVQEIENPLSLKRGHNEFISIPALATGYYLILLQTKMGQKTYEHFGFLIQAPNHLVAPAEIQKTWGPFLPIYALKSQSDWGIGSFRELKSAATNLVGSQAAWFGTLPLLPARFDAPDCDPSPYSSLSRLFWNEIYLDVENLVAQFQSRRANEAILSPKFQAEKNRLRELSHVDFYSAYQLKKEPLQILSEEFFQSGGEQNFDYQNYLSQHDDLESYAQFRSSDPKEQRFQKFCQFQTHVQLEQMTQKGMNLYMDYPVGVTDSGFDFKKYRDVFFAEVSVGAPPEPVFQKGQDWGFPSFHPEKLRRSHYKYFRKTLTHHLRFSKILRLDHVMGLHRTYVIPKGFAASEGVYMRFPPEDLFAISCIEAERNQCDLIGENLGTVPDRVNHILEKRKFRGMTVGQFLFDKTLPEMKIDLEKQDLLCLNNHDLPMFEAFVRGDDLRQVAELGILDPSFLESYLQTRKKSLAQWQEQWQLESSDHLSLFLHFLRLLASAKAPYFILNPEDAWQEPAAINIPGTYREYPNWRRKFKLPIEDWAKDPRLTKAIEILKHLRPLPQSFSPHRPYQKLEAPE